MIRLLLITATLLLFNIPTFAQTDALLQVQKEYEQFLAQKENLNREKLWNAPDELEHASELKAYKAMATKLNAISNEGFEASDRINYDLLKLLIEDRIFHLEFESHLFPLNSEGGFLTSVIYNIGRTSVNSESDFKKYTQKLNGLPDYFSKRIAQMKMGQEKGKSSPKLVVNNCIKLIDHLIDQDPSSTFFLKPVAGNEDRHNTVLAIVKKEVFPAYEELKSFLANDYLAKAPEKVGISEIKDGRKFYEQRVGFFTTSSITPEEVFEIGQSEVKRIRKEMEEIIASLEFEGSYADFLSFLRTDEQFYCKTGEDLLEKASWITKRMEGKLPQYFGKMPRMPLTVAPVPSALAPNYTAGRYSPGSYEQKRAGQFWVNTYNLPSRPLYVLPALALHEGVPGHHLQGMLAAEMEDVPKFRQRTYLSAYGEGWALYTEYLGKEAGIYRTAYEDFGRLTYEMWRACRLVVDPGMHYKGWTREQAVAFMSSNTALSLHEVNTEIDRYIGWPAQAVSYKIGELKIRELRKNCESQMGDKFSLIDFHDLVLSQGAVPLSTLEWMVNTWMSEVLKK